MSTLRAGRLGTRRSRGDRGARARAGVLRARAGLASLIILAATAVVVVLVAGILLVVLRANPSNEIVTTVVDGARWLAGPFDRMFDLARRRTEIAVNWGIAAAVYYVVARLVARVVAPG